MKADRKKIVAAGVKRSKENDDKLKEDLDHLRFVMHQLTKEIEEERTRSEKSLPSPSTGSTMSFGSAGHDEDEKHRNSSSQFADSLSNNSTLHSSSLNDSDNSQINKVKSKLNELQKSTSSLDRMMKKYADNI